MYVIEFQKHGLPHTHMLVCLYPDNRPKSIQDIDRLVLAEIPDKDLDPLCYNAVKNYMIHGPCGKDFPYSPCMFNGKCIHHFPKRYASYNLYLLKKIYKFIYKTSCMIIFVYFIILAGIMATLFLMSAAFQ